MAEERKMLTLDQIVAGLEALGKEVGRYRKVAEADETPQGRRQGEELLKAQTMLVNATAKIRRIADEK